MTEGIYEAIKNCNDRIKELESQLSQKDAEIAELKKIIQDTCMNELGREYNLEKENAELKRQLEIRRHV